MKLTRKCFLQLLGGTVGSIGLSNSTVNLHEIFKLLTKADLIGKKNVEYFGQPCRSKNVLASCHLITENSNEDWFVLVSSNEVVGAELIFLERTSNNAYLFTGLPGSSSWVIKQVSPTQLLVATSYSCNFAIFDLEQKKVAKIVNIPGESIIWNLAQDNDQLIYGGTFPGGKLVALNLKDYTLIDCGSPAKPNLYLRYVSATPDGQILCWFGMAQPATLLYNPETKIFSKVPEQLQGITQGASWSNYFLADSRAFEKSSFALLKQYPFPTPPINDGEWFVDVNLTNKKNLVFRQGRKIYSYSEGDNDLTLVANTRLRGGQLLAFNEQGEILGVRGQDYFFLHKGSLDLNLKTIPVESNPRSIFFLRADNQHRVWGGPPFGQTLFYIETSTNNVVNTGQVSDFRGEIYDVTFINDKVYAASYVRGEIIEYNPNESWDQWNQKNPKTIAQMSPAYIRPVGGIVNSKDGLLYSGWMAKYGVYGGAIAITNPIRGETQIIENPLGAQSIHGLAVDDSYIYVGTSLFANGLPRKRGELVNFGVIDIHSKHIVFTQGFMAKRVWKIIAEQKTNQIALVVDNQLQIFDPIHKKFQENLPTNIYPVTSSGICTINDGRIYYGSDTYLICFNLMNNNLNVITKLPNNVDCITANQNFIYVSVDADLYQIAYNRQVLKN